MPCYIVVSASRMSFMVCLIVVCGSRRRILAKPWHKQKTVHFLMHLLMPSLCRNLPAELLNLPAELLNPPKRPQNARKVDTSRDFWEF